METTNIWLLGVALAMDCFAVSLAGGVVVRQFIWRPMLTMALLFGIFQGGMLLTGYSGAFLFSHFLEPIDHWIAFSLLTYLGFRMICEDKQKEKECTFNPLDYKVILTLAIATSIDALAVGVSFAFVLEAGITILHPAGIIALVSFLFTGCGLYLGINAGRKLHLPAEAIGGCILIIIGARILLEHLT